MYALRRWSVRHAWLLSRLYALGEAMAGALAPVARLVPRGVLTALVRPVERVAKQTLFDCHMCGQCALSRTGMACPMNCPKELRNGPCGGVRADGNCEVKPEMPCVWIEAGKGRAAIGAAASRNARLLPVGRDLEGSSTWVQMLTGELARVDDVTAAGESVVVRSSASRLRAACASGHPVVTVEIGPPDSADPAAFIARANLFRGLVDAINVTDGAGGNCHMSSVAAAVILVREGLVPVAQVTCRDRNRIAIQGDVLGAAALGVDNFLCLTGDDVGAGDQPSAKRVFDLDAVNLVTTLVGMRDRAAFASGRKLEVPPDIFVGATCNPFAPPYEARVDNLERKIAAGAAFIQTQFCFDVAMMERFMRAVRARGLHTRATIIVGVGMLPTAKGLAWMAHHVPGVHVPDALIARVAAAENQRAEGIAAAAEIITRLRDIEGIGGFHLMGHRNERMLAEIIEKAGIGPSNTQSKHKEVTHG
ncbi:MAG: methylenetetrahydrofolate reductase C-terminal domain-containing protein [Pseudomonadota bacterium]|nr:methylenetetrahydrofolate reductase C-terminal domain-containing protein [Pseudomonadota bacterium]